MPSQKIVVPITSKGNFIQRQADETVKELKNYLKGEASRILKGDLDDTVQNWNEKPQMVTEYSEPYGVNMEVYAHPKGNGTTNWQRVSDGTGPRRIRSSKGIMVFQPGYSPKTTPDGRYGGSGARSGPYIRAWEVGPHRIEPRQFSIKIKVKREKQLTERIQQIFARVWR